MPSDRRKVSCLQRTADAYAIAFVTYAWALNIAFTVVERACRRISHEGTSDA